MNEGVQRAIRHIVFIRPNVMVILDDLKTQQPAHIQFLLHAIARFEIDADRRVVSIVNAPARADIYLLGPGPAEITQTDRFSDPVPADRKDRPAVPSDHWDQFHLTASFSPTSTVRRLLSVIVASRSDDTSQPPKIERLEERDAVGVQVGETTVWFRLDMPGAAVSCRGRRPDGTLKWLEYTQP